MKTAAQHPPNAWLIWWRANGRFGWLCSLLVGIALSLTVVYSPSAFTWAEHGQRSIKGQSFEFTSQGAVKPGSALKILITTEPTASFEAWIDAAHIQQQAANEQFSLNLDNSCGVRTFKLRWQNEIAEWPLGRPLDCQPD